MPESREPGTVLMEKNRMESLTDGIFAFAMTLLVTTMILPGNTPAPADSGAALVALLPDFYHYIIAFFVLAAFWMGHHQQFARLHHIDHTFLRLNVISLFFVTLVPFSTNFIGDYHADVTATCLFEVNLLILGLLFSLQWVYAARHHRLIGEDYPDARVRQTLLQGLIIPAISLSAILATLAGFESSTLFYLVSPAASFVVERAGRP